MDDGVAYCQGMPASDPRWQKEQERVKRTLAIDFDGVLHAYGQGWQDGTIYDEPLPGAVDACRYLVDQGFDLVIFTARQDQAAIHKWLRTHGFPEMDVTNMKPPALFYIDDRAIRFRDWEDC